MEESMMGKFQEDSAESDSVSVTGLDQLMVMAEEMERLKASTDDLKESLKEQQGRYDQLRKTLIPEEMQRVGLVNAAGKGKFTLSSGATISLRGDLFCGYKKEDEEAVFEWLSENGHGRLIKPGVHHTTLRAFAKEQMEEGKELPKDLFNVHPFSTATLRRN